MAKNRTSDERQWNMCGAEDQPDGAVEPFRCNRGLGHRGEHRHEGPDTPLHSGIVYHRWPRRYPAP